METQHASAEAVMAAARRSAEALMKSSQIWAEGMQAINKIFIGMAHAQFEYTTASVKALARVSSPKDAMEHQMKLAHDFMHHTAQEAGHLTEASMKLSENAMAPLTAHMAHSAEAMTPHSPAGSAASA